ncbi:exopolysaccharide biosynthesis protein [Falsiroseomonas oryziterrae]|uniref:exopolysaccharide biosynthesis protein n=1 Tax=Falsiroseomonas oryziterrae TaxID=2911368 RepID=UPI001F1C4D3A|nr:exopolysaccharide biosynthesis protein [Roseomonas sp. NPKOSM-4]
MMTRSVAVADRSVALGALADRFGMAGAGALLLLLAVPAFLPVPLPTGIPAGVAAAAIGAQIALGHDRPWLPCWARRFSLRRDQVASGIGRLFRILRRLGLRLRRRLPQAVGTHGAPRPLTGLVLVVCGIVLILPLPFGNQLPSLAIAAVGLGLLRGDGLFVLVGYAFAAATLAWTSALVFAGAEIMQALAGLLPAF